MRLRFKSAYPHLRKPVLYPLVDPFAFTHRKYGSVRGATSKLLFLPSLYSTGVCSKHVSPNSHCGRPVGHSFSYAGVEVFHTAHVVA